MKVASIKIHNILGIDDLEITPKEITRFEGKNNKGKTSAIEAIKAALKGGHDATLLRNGSDLGQIVILLDDGLEIKKTVTSDKTDLSVKYPKSGIKIEKPQTHLNALVDALSVNPIEFLSAPPSKRAEYLLQAMPLRVTREDLAGIYFGPIDPDLHAFKLLEAVEKQIYDDRTGVNRLADEKKKTAKQLGETLPLEPETIDWSIRMKEHAESLATAKNDLKNTKENIEQNYKNERNKIESEALRDQNSVERLYQEKLRDIQNWKSEEMARIALAETSAIGILGNSRNESLENSTSNILSAINTLTAGLAESEVKAKRQIADQRTQETIARVTEEAEKHVAESEALTRRLEALEKLRLRILSDLPIKGITVVDGQVMKDGVPYDRLNTASQIEIAVAIAKLRAKDLGIVCVDGLECLDNENFAEFERAIQGSGLQCFITRVTNPEGVGMEVITK